MTRETGWTVAQYRDQPMGDVFDLWEHLHEEPPAWRILAWRYLKPKTSRSRSAGPAPLQDGEVGEIARSLGVRPQPIPAGVRAQFEWAQAELAKRKKSAKSPRK